MTMRAGIDLVSVEDVCESLRLHADRYLQRVFTEREVTDCGGRENISPDRLAARFAAKEAARKVLRIDDESVPWRSIEVRREPGGWTELELHGAAAELAERSGMRGFSVSLTHEAGFASAVVIAEVGENSR